MLSVFMAEGKTAPEVTAVLDEVLGAPGEVGFDSECRNGPKVVALLYSRSDHDIYKLSPYQGTLIRRLAIHHAGPSY